MTLNVPSRKALAFANLRTVDLVRGVIAFRICAHPWLVRNAGSILKKSEAVLGQTLTYHTFVKWIMFDHFCAGQNETEIKPALRRLAALGIGPILDYAAEDDILDTEKPTVPADPRENVKAINMRHLLTVSADELEYSAKESDLDLNARRNMNSVGHAAENIPPSGISYVAIKLTALYDVQVLARVTALLLSVRRSWVALFCGKEEPAIEDCRVVVGRVISAQQRWISIDQFRRGALTLNPDLSKSELDELVAFLQSADAAHLGTVDYLDYTQRVADAILAIDVPVSGPLTTLRKMHPVLFPKERELMRTAMARTRAIAQAATEKGVRVMVDAEQTFYQMAIDQIVRELQREFNKEAPVIYNTYQCYTTIAEMRLLNDMLRGRREGWHWGGKMVRGAYMVQEREVANLLGYPSPIFPTKEGTDACYDRCAAKILDEIAIAGKTPLGVLFGSHNAESVQRIVDRSKQLPPHKCEIAVAQLYGMGNQISLPLAAEGFNVFKYVPYGPIKETTAYLLRRAVENSSMLSNPGSELHMMEAELRRRFSVNLSLLILLAVWCYCAIAIVTAVRATKQKND